MLYTRKAAAYLVALTLTLLFTTSEADFDIEEKKTAVNTLLNNLTSIVLEHRTKNLGDLIKFGDVLIEVMGLPQYLEEVAKDEQYFSTMLSRIDMYYNSFALHLHKVRLYISANKNVPVRDALIPMNGKLSELKRKILLKKTSGTQRPEQLETDEYTIYMRQITNKELYKEDKRGFIPIDGITAMLLLQRDLLKLVLDKNCNNLSSLNKIAGNIMNDETKLYEYVLSATDKFANAITREIDDYMMVIRDPLSNDIKDVVLSKIQEKCEKKLSEGSSQKGIGEDFHEGSSQKSSEDFHEGSSQKGSGEDFQ